MPSNSIVHTAGTTHYGTAGLVWVHGTPMLLRMHRIVHEVYFDKAIAHCTGADAYLSMAHDEPVFTISMRWNDGHSEGRTVITALTVGGRVATAILVRMQRRWRRVLEGRRHAHRLAVAMGSHPRLGRASPLYALDPDLLCRCSP